MDKYQDSILTKFNHDEHGNPISVSMVESQTVTKKGLVQLVQFPDEFQRVRVQTHDGTYLTETQNAYLIGETQYYVNYANGIVYFHPQQVGNSFKFTYAGRGVEMISTSRIFHKYSEEGDEFVQTLTEIVDNLVEVSEEAIEEEKQRQQNELERTERFNEQMTLIQQEVFDKDSEFQTQLSRQEEEFQAVVEHIQATETQLIENDEERQRLLDEKIKEVEEKILAEGNEYDQQQEGFETRFNEKLTEFNQQATDQRNEFEERFQEKLDEFQTNVGQSGMIDDTLTTANNTWSALKTNQEIEKAAQTVKQEAQTQAQTIAQTIAKETINSNSSTSPTSNKLVKYDSKGQITTNKVLLSSNGGLSAKADGLYAHQGSSESKILTSDDVTIESETSTIAKRDSSAALRSVRFNVYGADKVIRGQYSADVKYRPTWVKQGSTDTADREVILTENDIPYHEVGTWTPKPRVEGGSYIPVANSSAKYCAVGNMVFVSGWFTWDSLPSNTSGRLILQGLPFNNTGNATVGNIGVRKGAVLPSDGYHLICEMPSVSTTGTPEVRFYYSKANGTTSNYDCSNLSTSGEIHFAITYVIS